MRINVGCGRTPIKGWINFDNSPSLFLSKIAVLPELLYKLKFLDGAQYKFIQFCRFNKIEYGDPTKGLPIADNAADALYSSHMIEHLDQADARKFLKEARRVLCPGGIIRLVTPDLRELIKKYIESGDAEEFISSTDLCRPIPRTIVQRLKIMFTGDRNHRWMYDGESLLRLLTASGFLNASIMPPGKTKIQNPGLLDLKERESEGMYVEAENP